MHIFVADEQEVPLPTDRIRALAEFVMRDEGLPPDTEVSILFVTDVQIAEYNERFMSRQGPTDVLAFPLEPLEPGKAPTRGRGMPPVNLGDVVISPDYVRRQADKVGVGFEDEVSLMVVHGLLHLLGYDHEVDAEAEHMEARERDLLQRAAAAQ